MTTRALVLSGGGVVGIAWETGLVAGLAEAGVDLRQTDLIVGTSAGSVVGALLANGRPPSELLAAQLAPQVAPREAVESNVRPDLSMMATLAQKFIGLNELTDDVRREIGAMALEAKTVSEERWVGFFEERLAGCDWPERPELLITAADTATAEFAAWDRASGVPLARAVASSCAVPTLMPPVTINGKRYMDGGIRSVVNADLAQGYDIVLVASFTDALRRAGPLARGLQAEIDGLQAGGSAVYVIAPDEAATAAFGINPMDPAGRIPGAEAGVRQARALADELRAFWAAPVAVDGS
jgi:NTE family protein